MVDKKSGANASQTFRQFAWNLAGTLASTKGGSKHAAAKPGGKR